MLKLALPLLAVAVLAACEAPVTTTAPAAPAAANAMPFAGNWNCEGQTFTFTNQTYQPHGKRQAGSSILPGGTRGPASRYGGMPSARAGRPGRAGMGPGTRSPGLAVRPAR